MIVVVTTGLCYSIIYYNVTILSIKIALAVGLVITLLLNSRKPFIVFVLIGVSLLVGMHRIAEYPVGIHDDEVKRGKGLIYPPGAKWWAW